MMFLSSLVLAIVTALITVTVEGMFAEGPANDGENGGLLSRLGRTFLSANEMAWLRGIVCGVIVGAINRYAPQMTGDMNWLAPVSMAVMVAMYGYLIFRWCQDGADPLELLAFILLCGIWYGTFRAAAQMTMALTESDLLKALIRTIPRLVAWGAVFSFIINALLFHRNMARDNENEERQRALHLASWWARWLALIALLGILFFGVRSAIDWSALRFWENGTETTAEAGNEEPPTETTWYGFYNPSMQRDDDPNNDLNFGYNLAEYWDKDGTPTAEDYYADLKARMRVDPALGVAIMAWWDANLGTRYLGVFYDTAKQDWAQTMNDAKVAFMADQDRYNRTLDSFFEFTDSCKRSLTKGSGIKDQMYMNPHTTDGVPDIIVLTTEHDDGVFLTFTPNVKGDESKEVRYRTDCGYQPTDVEQVMKITPQDKPKSDPPKSTTPPKNDPPKSDPPKQTEDPPKQEEPPANIDIPPEEPPVTDPTPGRDVPPEQPEDEFQSPKDPTKGTPVGTNDDPGPGPDTNNGVGAWRSTKDTPEHSSSMTLPEYQEEIKQREDDNKTSRNGDEPNTPTHTPPERTDDKGKPDPIPVDNNGDTGNRDTGSAGINNPTTPRASGDTEDGSGLTSGAGNNGNTGTTEQPAADGAWGGWLNADVKRHI